MERIGDLMSQLGFREDGSDDVKKAFIRNLVKAAAQSGRPPAVESLHEKIHKVIQTPEPSRAPSPEKLTHAFEAAQITEEQLSFHFEVIEDAG